ncbi:MAG: hypothetical protein ABFS12_06850, partial [Bacteroidota bacterium]
MNNSRIVNFVVILSIFMTSVLLGHDGSVSQSEVKEKNIVPGKFIVKFKASNSNGTQASFSKLSSVAAQYNTKKQKQLFTEAKNEKAKKKLNLLNIFVFETDESADIQQIVNDLNNRSDIEYAEPVYLSKIEA